ncbi:MAG TPA: aromatic amino acid lyase, partial [Acidimicrobiia bacterium]
EGKVKIDGRVVPTSETDLEPIPLRAKEGLSLLNGTEGMAAMGALGLGEARHLLFATDAACALTVEAMMGSARPFREDIHQLRPHPGQMASASRIAGLLEGSGIGASHADDFDHAVQDAYSLRCAPQVHGAVSDTLDHMEAVLTREMGSVVDNPIVFPETGEVVSGGNFHGQPLAFVLDFATIAVAELGSISERRTDRLLDPARSRGLPAFLAPDPGVHSGYMISQYVQAALVAENKVLSHPASVDTIPTSGNQEDHVSMGWGAGRKLSTVLTNARRVVAIEILCAVQGVEYRHPLPPAEGTAALVELIRHHVPPLENDRSLSEEIEVVARLIADGSVTAAIGL